MQTEWFDGSIKPIVDGVYKRKFTHGPEHWARFEKPIWFAADTNYETARLETVPSPVQHSPMWAGCGETDWIDGDIKPVRGGVYKRLIVGEEGAWAKFEKGKWYLACSDYEIAKKERDLSFYQDFFMWKGIRHDI